MNFSEKVKKYAVPMYRVECSICADTFESSGCFYYGDESDEFDSFCRELKEAGWKESISKTYGHIGVHCADCHAVRNDPA